MVYSLKKLIVAYYTVLLGHKYNLPIEKPFAFIKTKLETNGLMYIVG